MCGSPKIQAPAPPPAAPPVLEQVAPKTAGGDAKTRKRKGLSAYKIQAKTGSSKSPMLGGIPKKTGV